MNIKNIYLMLNIHGSWFRDISLWSLPLEKKSLLLFLFEKEIKLKSMEVKWYDQIYTASH